MPRLSTLHEVYQEGFFDRLASRGRGLIDTVGGFAGSLGRDVDYPSSFDLKRGYEVSKVSELIRIYSQKVGEFLDEFEEDIEKTGALDTIMGSSRLKAAYQTVKKSLDRLYDDMVRFGAEVENLQAKTGAMTSDVMQRYQRGKRAMQSALLNYRSKRARSRKTDEDY